MQRHMTADRSANGDAVLVVDDDDGLRHLLCTVLQDAGYVVRTAHDGWQALALLRAAPDIRVALVDYRMPGLDGQQMLETIWDDPVLGVRRAFVMLSAEAAFPTAFTDKLARAGIPIVSKPFDLDDLLGAVEYAVSRVYQLQRPPREAGQ